MDKQLRKRLDRMFAPRSVAVIGAGATPDKVGHAIMDSLVTGGFPGDIYPVHPKHREILGIRVFSDIDFLPEIPDLAVVALNQESAIKMVAQLSKLGVGGVSVIAGGFSEMGGDGSRLQLKLAEAAENMPIVGPNTLGFLNARARLNVTFYPRELKPGNVSYLSQSGGIGLALKGRSDDEGLGIAKWIGVGNRANLEFHDLIEYLREDDDTQVIGLFIEGTSNPRRLAEQISLTTKNKPVLVYKGGRGENADRVTVSHTGAAAGRNEIWSGALKQAGARMVCSTAEMIAEAKALSIGKIPSGKRIGIFTHTAGPSIVAWDILRDEPNAELPDLNDDTLTTIASILGPSVPVIHKNPVDGAAGAFLTQPFHDIAEAVLNDENVDLLLAIFCEHKNWIYPTEELIELAKRFNKSIVACFIGTLTKIASDRDKLQQAGIPAYVLPEDAAVGVRALLSRVPHEI